MKRVAVVLAASAVLAAAAAFAISGCAFGTAPPTAGQVSDVLALSGNEFYGQAGPVGLVARIVAPSFTITDEDGDTAVFSYSIPDSALVGTVAYTAYNIDDSAGNVYEIDGTIALTFTVDAGSFIAHFVGSLQVSKNGGEAAVYSIDLQLTATVEVDGSSVVLTVAKSGTVNGSSVAGTRVFTLTTS